MNSQDFTSKNVDDAIRDGLSKMGITESQAIIEVLEKGGIFRKAKVRITSKGTEGERAIAFIDGLTEIMDIACTTELKETDEVANIEIISVNSGAIIGHRGDVLDSIQYLASIVANEGKQNFKRIVIDCENYRERRVETLEALGKRMADKAVTSARRVKLEPMNAFERRVIHAFLTNDERVSTSSYGEDPYRYLSITPKNMKPRRDGFKRDGFKNDNFKRDDFKKDGYRGDNFKKDGYKKDFGDRKPRENGGERPYADRPRKPAEPSSYTAFGYIGNSNDEK